MHNYACRFEAPHQLPEGELEGLSLPPLGELEGAGVGGGSIMH